MNIRGLSKTSLVDYPGKVAAVVFVGGCNLRCGYCHNPDLALNNPALEKIDDAAVYDYLVKRDRLLDGVVISGGEPAMDRGLISFLEKIRPVGLSIKLDTNGFFPRVISECLEKGLVDYVALDIKTSPGKYTALTCREVSFNDILSTLEILKESSIDYEVRTTCVPGFATVDDIKKIGESTGRVKRYCLQQFVNSHTLLDSGIKMLNPYNLEYINSLKAEAEKFSEVTLLRGV